MAKIIQMRPPWHRRSDGILYLFRGQLCLRSYPSNYRDRRSAAQLRQRNKFKAAQQFLLPLRDLFALGFQQGQRPNGRRIGAVHMALGAIMRNAMKVSAQGCQIIPENIALTDRESPTPAKLRIERNQQEISVSWMQHKGLKGGHLLIAARNEATGELFSEPIEIWNSNVIWRLPNSWAPVECTVWAAFISQNRRVRSATKCVKLKGANITIPPIILLLIPCFSPYYLSKNRINPSAAPSDGGLKDMRRSARKSAWRNQEAEKSHPDSS